jgi:hypothetical protein
MRSIVVGLAAVLVGCTAEAPQRPVTPPLQPVVGEGQKAIAERAFIFVAVYQFESGGHRYSLGNASDAQQRDSYSELVFLAVGISNAYETAADKTAVERNAKWRAATTTEEVVQLLGKPVIEFSLPNVNTRVMAYRLDDGRPYYVGLSDDKPIWFHNEYPWLHELAEQAIAQQERAPKKR